MQYLKERRFSPDLSDRLKRFFGVDFLLPFLTVLFFIYFAYLILFGERNIFTLIKKEAYRNSLQQEVLSLQEENKKLLETIQYLKNDRFFIEKKAREDLGLIKEGEEVFIIVDEKNVQPAKKERWIDRVIQKYQTFHLR